MKITRRDFLIGSMGLTLGGCVSGPKMLSSSQRKPNALDNNKLGYRFSSAHEELKSHYNAIVVGSGYGASVMALRLADKLDDMCILERGKEWHPGDFPENFSNLALSLKSPLHPLGLVDISSGKDVDIICASGLGGTSLINAAIAIRPEMNVFAQDQWPEEIKQAAKNGDLERYYQRAESMLQPYQHKQMRFQKSKTHFMSAQEQKKEWGELYLNIRPETYAKESNNDFGYPQSGCAQCGNCCTGCNIGAKNTLLTNYLYSAYKKGVKVFTQIEVQSVEKINGLYQLNLKLIPSIGFPKYKKVTANYVFLGAGSKGSTEILLRSQAQSLSLSNKLGSRLSANGDVMGMAYNGKNKTNILAISTDDLASHPNRPGPIIASYANYRNPSPLGDVDSQFLLLDGVIPSALAPSVAHGLASFAISQKNKYYKNSAEHKTALERLQLDLKSLTANEDGALNHSMLYFACGHDSSGGKFVYNKTFDSFDYQWAGILEEKSIQRVNQTMKSYADKNEAIFIANPRSTVFGGKKIQATHPLGGCPMGKDSSEGVVNHRGQVFNSEGGIHQNLYVVDAAIIPRSLSATPLLTITALAERMADEILKEIS